MRYPVLLTALPLFVLFGGCTEFVQTGPAMPARPAGHPVAVYYSEELPVTMQKDIAHDVGGKPLSAMPTGGKEIGRLDISGMGAWQHLVPKGQEKARELGGDAIVIGSLSYIDQVRFTVFRYGP